MFEQEYAKFLDEQRRSASGARLERLHKDLTGEKKLLEVVIWPVLKSFDGITMEQEMVSTTGVKIYIDAVYEPLRIAFESNGYVPHAETITRDRFSFEQMRIRTIAMQGYRYIPFSWDEQDKKGEVSRRAFYELLGRFSTSPGLAFEELSVFEREVIRYALRLARPLRLEDARYCLQSSKDTARKVLYRLVNKKFLKPIGSGDKRYHQYEVTPKARDYFL